MCKYISAPPTHASPASRNVPHTTSVARPDHTGVDTTGHSQLADRPTDGPSRGPSRPLSRQVSKSSVLKEQNIAPILVADDKNTSQYEEPLAKDALEKLDDKAEFEQKDEVLAEQPVEEHQEYPQNYENYDPSHVADGQYEQPNVPENAPYESNVAENVEYDQTQEAQLEYPNQFEQQQYEQPAYTEGQYENYEQYPQQYTDPNAQYEGQYENYATDGNYQNEQKYDNTETPQYNPEYAQEYQEPQPVEPQPNVDLTESKRSNSPNDKVTSQS